MHVYSEVNPMVFNESMPKIATFNPICQFLMMEHVFHQQKPNDQSINAWILLQCCCAH